MHKKKVLKIHKIIQFCQLMNKLEQKKIAGVNVWSIYAPFESYMTVSDTQGLFLSNDVF